MQRLQRRNLAGLGHADTVDDRPSRWRWVFGRRTRFRMPESPSCRVRFVLVPGAGGNALYWYRVEPLLARAGSAGRGRRAPQLRRRDLCRPRRRDRRGGGGRVRRSSWWRSRWVPSLPRWPASGCRSQGWCWSTRWSRRPGETAGDWWANTDQAAAVRANDAREGREHDPAMHFEMYFLHDVPAEVVERIADSPGTAPRAPCSRSDPHVGAGQMCPRPCWPVAATGSSRTPSSAGSPRAPGSGGRAATRGSSGCSQPAGRAGRRGCCEGPGWQRPRRDARNLDALVVGREVLGRGDPLLARDSLDHPVAGSGRSAVPRAR